MDGIQSAEHLERSSVTLTSETIDTRGINAKTLIFDHTYTGTYPSASASPISSPTLPTILGDQDIVEQLPDGTNYLTRIRLQTTGLRVIWPTIKITWSWTSP